MGSNPMKRASRKSSSGFTRIPEETETDCTDPALNELLRSSWCGLPRTNDELLANSKTFDRVQALAQATIPSSSFTDRTPSARRRLRNPATARAYADPAYPRTLAARAAAAATGAIWIEPPPILTPGAKAAFNVFKSGMGIKSAMNKFTTTLRRDQSLPVPPTTSSNPPLPLTSRSARSLIPTSSLPPSSLPLSVILASNPPAPPPASSLVPDALELPPLVSDTMNASSNAMTTLNQEREVLVAGVVRLGPDGSLGDKVTKRLLNLDPVGQIVLDDTIEVKILNTREAVRVRGDDEAAPVTASQRKTSATVPRAVEPAGVTTIASLLATSRAGNDAEASSSTTPAPLLPARTLSRTSSSSMHGLTRTASMTTQRGSLNKTNPSTTTTTTTTTPLPHVVGKEASDALLRVAGRPLVLHRAEDETDPIHKIEEKAIRRVYRLIFHLENSRSVYPTVYQHPDYEEIREEFRLTIQKCTEAVNAIGGEARNRLILARSRLLYLLGIMFTESDRNEMVAWMELIAERKEATAASGGGDVVGAPATTTSAASPPVPRKETTMQAMERKRASFYERTAIGGQLYVGKTSGRPSDTGELKKVGKKGGNQDAARSMMQRVMSKTTTQRNRRATTTMLDVALSLEAAAAAAAAAGVGGKEGGVDRGLEKAREMRRTSIGDLTKLPSAKRRPSSPRSISPHPTSPRASPSPGATYARPQSKSPSPPPGPSRIDSLKPASSLPPSHDRFVLPSAETLHAQSQREAAIRRRRSTSAVTFINTIASLGIGTFAPGTALPDDETTEMKPTSHHHQQQSNHETMVISLGSLARNDSLATTHSNPLSRLDSVGLARAADAETALHHVQHDDKRLYSALGSSPLHSLVHSLHSSTSTTSVLTPIPSLPTPPPPNPSSSKNEARLFDPSAGDHLPEMHPAWHPSPPSLAATTRLGARPSSSRLPSGRRRHGRGRDATSPSPAPSRSPSPTRKATSPSSRSFPAPQPTFTSLLTGSCEKLPPMPLNPFDLAARRFVPQLDEVESRKKQQSAESTQYQATEQDASTAMHPNDAPPLVPKRLRRRLVTARVLSSRVRDPRVDGESPLMNAKLMMNLMQQRYATRLREDLWHVLTDADAK